MDKQQPLQIINHCLTLILVSELTLEHINKQRVQLRPKRRPPTRDFVRSRASLDFDFYVPEEIKEEDEDEKQNEAVSDKVTVETHTSAGRELESTPPSRPTPPPKPAERNGWKLPTSESQVVLRKTKNENIQEVKSEEEIEENINDITPQSSPEKKQKERKRFKHLFKFRRSRKGKQNGKTSNMQSDVKTNLTETYSMSVDSGLNSEHSRRRWPNRRSHKSREEKGLNWLLGIFHKKQPHGSTTDTKETEHIPEDAEGTAESAKHAPNVDITENPSDPNSNGKSTANGTVSELELGNGDTSHEDVNNTESVSNLRQKFERFSMVS